MEAIFNTSEQGSREWRVLEPLHNDKVSMFGTPHAPSGANFRDAYPAFVKTSAGRREKLNAGAYRGTLYAPRVDVCP